MTIPKITPYTGGVANPDGSQTQTEFTQNMFDQLSYEAELSTELNNTVDGINDTATQVDADATSASQSAAAAEAAVSGLDYQGLWPDTGGSANKGETWQTQVSGTPTGQYFTALQNTTADPVWDDVNWREVVSVDSFSQYTDIVYKASGGNSAVENMIIGVPYPAKLGSTCRTGQTNWVIYSAGGVALDNGLFARASEIHVKDYGVTASSTTTEVLAALNQAIADIDLCGGGQVVISADLQYGYRRGYPTTHPQMKSNVNNCQVVDYGIGNSSLTPGFEDGSQTRTFYHTPNIYEGKTDGNGNWIHGDYHPYYAIDNNANLAAPDDPSRTANDNYRASIMYTANGTTKWLWGMGGATGASFTEDEMTDFRGVINDIPDLGVTGLVKWVVVNKESSAIAFNTPSESKNTPYEFGIRAGFASGNVVYRGVDQNPFMRLIGPAGEAGIKRGTSNLELKIDNVDCYTVSTNGSSHRMISQTGNVNLFLDSENVSRRMLLSDASSEIRIQATDNTTNTLVHNDSGDLAITGSYSPFTGTHIFFSESEIESGLAVDLVDTQVRSYPTWVDIEKETLVPVDFEPIFNKTRIACEVRGEEYVHHPKPNEAFKVDVEVEQVEKSNEIFGTVSVTSQENSKICAGVVDHQIQIEGGYITYVAACGDNMTPYIKGFKTNSSNGEVEAGDILVTSSTAGELMKADVGLPESVVRFKAMSAPDSGGVVYGYFK